MSAIRTGGGEVARYVARFGGGHVAKAVLISAVPPLMLKTAANPGGLPIEVFDGLRAALAADRAQFYRDLPAGPFYGFNRPGVKTIDGVVDNWWRQGMIGGAKAQYDGIKAFSETDFTSDLKAITVPVLVMHGDDDQIVPYADAGPLSAKLLKHAELKIYKGFPHGMITTQGPKPSTRTCSPSSAPSCSAARDGGRGADLPSPADGSYWRDRTWRDRASMTPDAHPRWRSLLFVPAHVERFVARAHERGADGIILDVEDSVPAEQKSAARAGLAASRRVRHPGRAGHGAGQSRPAPSCRRPDGPR